MKLNLKYGKAVIALMAVAIATAAIAASFSAAVNVSNTTKPTEKAKSARLVLPLT